MEDLPIQKPRNALEELLHLIFPINISEDSCIELVISIASENISIRDLSAFLELVDHIYGRLTPEGFRSYARRDFGHLKISRIQEGTWELIIETTLSTLKQSGILLIIWLVLKYLPQAFKTTASAYNEYEQGRLARETRKRIKMEMEENENLRKLSPNHRRDLIALIDILYSREAQKLPRVSRFARKALLGVDVKVRKNQKNKRSKEDS